MAPRFPNSWVDMVYDRSSIVDVVNGYLPLQKKGRKYWGLCPFHNEKTASFSVNAEQNLYYCFGCKASGNVVQFVMEMERLSYPEALTHLAKMINLPSPPMMEEDPEEERRRNLRDRLVEANREAAVFYHQQLWTPAGEEALNYLHQRGLDDGIIRRFGLGFSPNEWDSLYHHLSNLGFTQQEQQQAGLLVVKENSQYDQFRRRVMFPIINRFSQTIGFGARAMGDAQPKYLNTADSMVFNKRKNVYAINFLNRQRNLQSLVLVEGYLDVIALAQNGINNAVATLGTALTPEQARLMKNYAPEILLAYDGDEPGQMAIQRALELLGQEGIPARVLKFPGGEDPDDLIRKHGAEAFHALKPMQSMAFRLLRLEKDFDVSQEDQRREYAKQACELVAVLRDPVELDHYLGKISLKTGISKEVLIAQTRLNLPRGNPEPVHASTPPLKRTRGGESTVNQPEFTLVSLLASGLLPEGLVQQTDFDDERLRQLAGSLLAGHSTAVILSEAPDDASRALAGEVFNRLPDLDSQGALTAAEDCLRTIRTQKLDQRIKDLTLELKGQDSGQKAMTLHLIGELQNELSQVKQAKRPL